MLNRILSLLLLRGFDASIRKLITEWCDKSILKESLFNIGIGTVSYLIGGHFEPKGVFNSIFTELSQTACNSTITGCVNVVLKDSQEWIGDRLDAYGYDEYINYVEPLLDIGGVIALRQIAGLMLEFNIPSAMLEPMSSDSQPHASTSSNILTKISNALSPFFNLGKSTQANQPNILSQAFNCTADYMLFGGVEKLITSIFTSVCESFSDNQSKLSVYDIKNILKAQIPAEEYNRAAVMAQAEKIMAEIQWADNYYQKFENKPDIQKNIDIVTNLYLKNIGAQFKTQYASTLANNPQLIEKSELLVEKLMKFEVISRLMSARTTYAKIQEIKVMNILPDFIDTELIKELADMRLNEELKLFSDATVEEQAKYKNLFSKAAMNEVYMIKLFSKAAMNEVYMIQDNLHNELAQMESDNSHNELAQMESYAALAA